MTEYEIWESDVFKDTESVDVPEGAVAIGHERVNPPGIDMVFHDAEIGYRVRALVPATEDDEGGDGA